MVVGCLSLKPFFFKKIVVCSIFMFLFDFLFTEQQILIQKLLPTTSKKSMIESQGNNGVDRISIMYFVWFK